MNIFDSKVDHITEQELNDIKTKKKCYDGPITGNIKCIIISLALAALYWFLPSKNKYVLLTILYVTYLLIAYYDHFYDCRRGQFGPTFLKTYYDWAKPKTSKQSIIYSNMCPDKVRTIMIVDIAVFVCLLFAAPIFFRWTPKK
jgi:hypothetical protein|tara:strand:+ start:747 stop:1175 length:429 start_codon:yes stop_codon:yes gene_type:complete